MPLYYSGYTFEMNKADRRKKKKAYWMDKGCSERKAEKLLYRYGY